MRMQLSKIKEIALSVLNDTNDQICMPEMAALCLDAVHHAMDVQPHWSNEAPTQQGMYWHWSGNADDAPLVLSVLYSGGKKECFVSAGQYGIKNAVYCSEYGGLWANCPQPELPIH